MATAMSPVLAPFRAVGEFGARLMLASAELAGPRGIRALQALRGVRSFQRNYEGARMSRLELDFIAANQKADEEIKRDAYTLRARARALSRNNSIAKRYLSLAVDNVVGPNGFDHRAQVLNNDGKPNKVLNGKIDAAYDEWSWSVTLDGKYSMAQLCRQLFTSARRDGEIFVRKWRTSDNPFGLLLEPVDADQVDHRYNEEARGGRNEIRMGIEVDEKGRPVAYYLEGARRTRVPASEIIHIYDPARANQSRGVTDFHSVTLQLHFIEQYSHYALVAARSAAAMPLIWEKQEGGIPGAGNPDPQTPAANNSKPVMTELQPGLWGYAPDGYKATTIDLKQPSAMFAEFMKEQKREASSGLNVSYGELANDYSDASFSAQRSAMLATRDTWKSMQAWFIGAFLRPVYKDFILEAMLAGAATGGKQGLLLDARDPKRFLAAKFSPRDFPWIDPLKDINADTLAIDNVLACATDVLAEQGRSFEEVARKRAEEIALCRELGIPSSSAEIAANAKQALVDSASADAEAAKQDAAAREMRALRNGHSKNPALTAAD